MSELERLIREAVKFAEDLQNLQIMGIDYDGKLAKWLREVKELGL